MTANLLDFDLEGLAAFCERLGEKRFRATQLFRWIHQRGAREFDQMSDLAKSLREKLKTSADRAAAGAVGKLVAERAIAAGVKDVVFDRGRYLYHGRVKALAEGARASGLQF